MSDRELEFSHPGDRADIEQLLRENARLRAGVFDPGDASPVACPPELRPLFDRAATALREHFGRIDAANLRRAHALLESHRAKGKIVLEGW